MAPPTDSRNLLVVSAHSADFVWRAAGAIATTTANGGTATVVSLSFGERGESGELWKEEGQTVDKVKAIRRAEAEKAAGILGGLWERVRQEPANFLDARTIEKEGLDAAARDFLAGMTDRYAVTLYEELFIPKPWVSARGI